MNKKHPSGMFMMEMIAVIFFFILCAAICIQAFVKADTMSRKASDLNRGVLIAQSVVEVWKAEGPKELQKQFQAEISADDPDVYVMGFDEGGDPCEIKKAFFDVKSEFPKSGQAEVTISRGGREVYTLRASRHEIPN